MKKIILTLLLVIFSLISAREADVRATLTYNYDRSRKRYGRAYKGY